MTGSDERLYSDLASWWPILSTPEDYEPEARYYSDLLVRFSVARPADVLELGSGGGNNASHMKRRFRLTLVDKSEGMLEVSRAFNPECEHIQGDMRTIRLNRLFDAVFIHDAIMYMTTLADLAMAVRTAYLHCREDGVALFVPDYVKETFKPFTKHGGHDASDRALRYVEWVWDPDPNDCTNITDFAYLLRDKDGKVRCEYDRHVCGLFGREEWLKTLADVGFEAKAVNENGCDEPELGVAFVGIKRSS